LSFTGDVRYERDQVGERVAGLLSLTVRLGRYSTLVLTTTRGSNRARVSFNTFKGSGVGAYNIAADVERSDFGSGANVVANYYANRAEVGFNHFGTFENDFGNSIAQRTSLRLASSLAFADGGFSVGRPIYDSFAIVKGHRALDNANILVEPSPFGLHGGDRAAQRGDPANLSSYAERTITIDAPTAPAGFDLGQAHFGYFLPTAVVICCRSDRIIT
jgi:outer membrane usher protein